MAFKAILEWNMATMKISGAREHKKTNFRFWGTGEQGNKGTGNPCYATITHCIRTHGKTRKDTK